ncbi:hypothetical protein [Draconibacterium mangrovi]|uniref:hypothetical protein n=1 Tax=Draconibacterium mangrovi TaxID=2697469 RepID=UPI0013D3235B|nr:hypothetical protein [Draconibacterium mangrovi]
MNYNNEIQDLLSQITLLRSEIDELKNSFNEALWDNSDMIKNWNISKRTLASWRANGLIEYVKAGDKIWYTKQQRDDFLRRNTVKT